MGFTKKTERSEGKICRVWTTCWAPVIPWKAVVILSVLWTNLQIIEEPVVDLGWACAVETVIDSLFLAPLTQHSFPGAIETTNGEKGAQVLMPYNNPKDILYE